MRVAKIVMLLALPVLAACCGKRSTGEGAGAGEGDGVLPPTAEAEGPLKMIHFAFDSSALSAESKAILKDNAQWLDENAATTATVEGHCDERGTSEYNMALGERRARAAYDYLRKLGVSADRLSTISYGKEMPIDSGRNESAWAMNRRAQFRVK